MGYGSFVGVWLALVMLTALTVAVSGVRLHSLSVITALAIATIKTSIVLSVFMHLKYEKSVLKIMLYATLLTFVIFLALTFVDVYFR